MKKKSKGVKKVKAWAVMNGKRIATICLYKPVHFFYVGSWSFEVEGKTIIPCEITYHLTKEK